MNGHLIVIAIGKANLKRWGVLIYLSFYFDNIHILMDFQTELLVLKLGNKSYLRYPNGSVIQVAEHIWNHVTFISVPNVFPYWILLKAEMIVTPYYQMRTRPWNLCNSFIMENTVNIMVFTISIVTFVKDIMHQLFPLVCNCL